MSTVEKDAQVLVKRSWKLPVVYVAASILLLVFGVSTHGDVTIRLNDKSQSYSIPDIVTSGAPIVWVLVALTILVTACELIVTVRRIDVPSWARAVGMSVVGVSTILGFLLYAGSDSAGAVTLTSTLVSTVAISTPLIFGALSGVISERVGVVNIAIEGDLLVGAFAGIMAASYFQTAYAGLVAAPLAGALLGALLALALAGWHSNYRFCPRCGAPVQLVSGGWAARCETCDRLEYPRQDPAIIVLVQDHEGRVLLAHNALWRPGFVSIIAGYVEAGESPDVAVAREVAEEVGVEIETPTYVATQPWPFGRSQMMGYQARTASPFPTPQADGVEIEWARFYSRDELTRALEAGKISAPGRASIAYALLRDWYGADLPSDPDGAGRN